MLTPPTLQELGDFRQESYTDPSPEATQAEILLLGATDAIWVFTGLEDTPTDARIARILKNAICDLALWLTTQAENREEINSPFSGEHIGSYSYSKMQQASDKAKFGGEGSGLFWLDLLFRVLTNDADFETSWTNSENVFNPAGLSYHEFEGRLREAEENYSPWGAGGVIIAAPQPGIVDGGEP